MLRVAKFNQNGIGCKHPGPSQCLLLTWLILFIFCISLYKYGSDFSNPLVTLTLKQVPSI